MLRSRAGVNYRQMPELDARKQTILQAVIFEYVSSADPVGSELLVQRHGLGVKSATVRNELADLTEMGDRRFLTPRAQLLALAHYRRAHGSDAADR